MKDKNIVHCQELRKPDGRALTLYSRSPIPENLSAPSPSLEPIRANPHLRWHPLRGEWIAYASHRQGRTFMPPPEYNPLSPTHDPQYPTELPAGDYDIAVFDNRFPSLTLVAQDPPPLMVETLPPMEPAKSSSLPKIPTNRSALYLSIAWNSCCKFGAIALKS